MKKIFAIFASAVLALSMTSFSSVSADDNVDDVILEDSAKDYTFDELMEMSDEELEAVGYGFVVETIDEWTARHRYETPNEIPPFCNYEFILKDSNMIPKELYQLNEIISAYECYEFISSDEYIAAKEEAAKIVGLCGKVLDDISVCEDVHPFWSYMEPDSVADVLKVDVNYYAYGKENYYKTILIAQHRIDCALHSENKNILEHYVEFRIGTSSTTVTWFKSGDVNTDYVVDISDVILLSRYIAEDPTISIPDEGLELADTNGDGILNGADVVVILQMIARLYE